MDYDDFDEYEDDSFGAFSSHDFTENHNGNENDLNPFNLCDPEMVYFLFCDDAHDELRNPLNHKLRCQLCGHEF
jgi:hypothetical protein